MILGDGTGCNGCDCDCDFVFDCGVRACARGCDIDDFARASTHDPTMQKSTITDNIFAVCGTINSSNNYHNNMQ